MNLSIGGWRTVGALLLAGLAWSTAPPSPSAASAAPLPPLSGPSAGGIYEAQLDNGLRVLIKEVHTAPLLCVSVWYQAGSAHEEVGTTGLAHLLEHMMFKGTSKYGKGVYDRMLEGNGAQNNASTWLDRTQYFVLIAADKADLALELEADRMRGALFTQQDLVDEMPVVRNEMEKSEDDPASELSERIQSMAYLESPYHWPTIGWKTDVESITAAEIHAYYDNYYWPNNAFLVLVGDLPAKSLLEKAVHHFGGIPRGGVPPKRGAVEPPQKGERRFLIREAGQNRILSMGFRVPGREDPDGYALDLLGRILGAGESSRLYRALVQSGLATDVSAYNMGMFKYPYLFAVDATLAEDVTPDAVEQAIEAEIAKISSEPPTEAEMSRARKQSRVETLFERDNITSLMFSIGESEIGASYAHYETYLDSIQTVVPTDVRDVAARYLVTDSRTVGFYLPDGQAGGSWIDAEPATMKKRTSEGLDLPGYAPDTRHWRNDPEREPSLAHPVEGEKSTLSSNHRSSAIAEPGVSESSESRGAKGEGGAGAGGAKPRERIVLSNGAVLLVQESRENPTLEIRARSAGGALLDPKGKEGLAILAAQTMTRGTTSHTATEFAELLESNGVTLYLDASADEVTLGGRALAEDLPLLVHSIGEVLTSANFPEDQIEITRNQLQSQLREKEEDTFSRALQAALGSVYGVGSAYARFVEGSEASLSAITRSDLEEFRKQLAQGDRWIFAVVGDVDAIEAKALFEKALEKVPAGQPLAIHAPEFNLSSATEVQKIAMEDKSQTDIVCLGPALRPNDPGYRAAFLANVVLGGSFASRLNGELRDNEGLTYGASSRIAHRLGSSYFYAALGVNPENIEKGLIGVRRELQKIHDHGITEEELNRAKEYAAGSFPIRLQSKGAVAETLIFAEVHELGADYITGYGEKLRTVTAAEVGAAVRRFTDGARMVAVQAGTF